MGSLAGGGQGPQLNRGHEEGSTEDHIVLKGGIANAGAVVRIGGTVRRPSSPQMNFVHSLMQHLRNEGCEVVPEPLGVDREGREVLAWIPGEAAADPWPDWAGDEDLLLSVAQTQQQLHSAAASYENPADAQWATTAGDYFPPGVSGSLLCHNDLSLTNVVVAGTTVAGVIDWDFAAPVDPLFDIMVTARHWIPFAPPEWRIEPLSESDATRRWTLFADAHELTRADRERVISLAPLFIEQAGRNISQLAKEAGHGSGYQALIDRGYLNSVADTLAWLARTDLQTPAR